MERKRMRWTVEVTEFGGSTRTMRVLAEDAQGAVERALTRQWGKRAFWHRDSGVPGCGQVFWNEGVSSSGWSASALTGRARLDVSRGWS